MILAVAGIGSTALVLLVGAASLRRRTSSYFLIAGAVGMMGLRSVLGMITLGGVISLQFHHVLEHLLDVVVIALLFGAIYFARSVDPERPVTDSAGSDQP